MTNNSERPITDQYEDVSAARPGPAVDRRHLLLIGAGVGAAAVGGLAVPLLRRLGGTDAAAGSSTAAPAAASAAVAPTPAPSSSTTTSTAEVAPTVASDQVSISIEDGVRVVRSTGIPEHPTTGRYVADVSAQSYEYRMTTTPALASSSTEVTTGTKFGVHLNGVPFDPATAGFYDGDPSNGWLQDASERQLDDYGAHTQPNGAYHYHRITDTWDTTWGGSASTHGALVGWAADGFPVYLRYGYADPTDAGSGVVELASSWLLKSGPRPSGAPDGSYDGTWVQDYEYVEGLGDLDQCNGRYGVTPEFPGGTYAYFLTTTWPEVPRWLAGTPDSTFLPPQGRGPVQGQGGQGRGPAGGSR